MIKKLLNFIMKKLGYEETLIVPPNADFHTKNFSVSNKTDKCLIFWTTYFTERRKEERRDDPILKD